jgi:hypothetical protein
MSYLPPVVCRMAHDLFTSSCLKAGSCLLDLQVFKRARRTYIPPVVLIRHEPSYKQLEVKTNRTNTSKLIRHEPSYKQLEVKTNMSY